MDRRAASRAYGHKSAGGSKRTVADEFDRHPWWVNANNNWNQVCNSGLSIAAIALANQYPKLAARIISRALRNLPTELANYSPDGAYPEGPSYWSYGTSWTLVGDSAFQSAFGTDCLHLVKIPGFIKSATYKLETIAPSERTFDYSDSGETGLDLNTQGILTWFAQKTGDGLYLNQGRMLSMLHKAAASDDASPGFAPIYLVWLSQFKEKNASALPAYWEGRGHNPIAVFRAQKDVHTGFYLGVKGGSASANHGNMDVGSFVFELHGVRWSIDPGSRSYHAIEEVMGSKLWDESQDSQRWSLLTKNNRFHSTLTVNGERHNVDGFAPITKFQVEAPPELVSLDLSSIFAGQLNRAIRTFKKVGPAALQIEDDIEPSEKTKTVMWAMMTRANVITASHGAILKQDHQTLQLKIIKPAQCNVSVVSLDPPPLSYDKRIKGLKRIEIKIPSYLLKNQRDEIVVELTGEKR
ncbi:MAG: heparinase II/III domain-containing protein [Bryobacteraceae bacterium]